MPPVVVASLTVVCLKRKPHLLVWWQHLLICRLCFAGCGNPSATIRFPFPAALCYRPDKSCESCELHCSGGEYDGHGHGNFFASQLVRLCAFCAFVKWLYHSNDRKSRSGYQADLQRGEVAWYLYVVVGTSQSRTQVAGGLTNDSKWQVIEII